MKTLIHETSIESRMAVFSDDMQDRYELDICWDKGSSEFLNVIGLNPSTADEMNDDPTIRRCKDFAKRFGCGRLIMTNLFSIRATDPKEMLKSNNPGDDFENTTRLVWAASRSGIRLAAWGAHGKHRNRALQIKALIPNLVCLGLTKGGQPKHPLYLKSDLLPLPFK